ncbi:ABC transporter ATP-binding protein [Sphingomonas sp.]|uniref:ABC transporter ATP-binding protein n=1 Tax=Sphingomonas sp. TaxID=28214 RepID=UPI0031D3F85B
MSAPLVRVENLRVVARGDDGREVPIVHDVSLDVAPGEVVALIGESGSGKTTIALTLLGYARAGCRIAGGRIEVAGVRLDGADAATLRQVRGRTVAYVAQSAAAAFNPALPIMRQVIEPALIHGVLTRPAAEAKARELFRALGLPDPDGVGDRYPHQVSGGQLQRLMAAMALITDPQLVIFDEPTTALDVTTQIEVLRVFKAVVRDLGTTAVYVSHDLAVVAQIADRIVVLRQGAVQEVGATDQMIDAPAHDYSRALLAAAVPRSPPPVALAAATDGPPLLELEEVVAGYGATTIVDRVSFAVPPGRVIGVIGESGSGKSTIARVVAGLHAPSGGSVRLSGRSLPPRIADRTREDLRRVQLVFQSADTALNPSVPVGRALGRPLTLFHDLRGAALTQEVRRLLDLVHLPADVAQRLPGELSGGQKQRVNLARALAARPDLILCDEVTSALDPVVAEAVLDLLVELRRELGVSYMFITHDLNIVRAIADDVVVLQRGCVVERSSAAALFAAPAHPYTQRLMRSVPELRRGWLEEACAGR